ncbi:acyltransferase [Deltaproteobacteria bacterium TL4]
MTRLFSNLKGVLSLGLYAVNALIFGSMVMILGLFKMVFPYKSLQPGFSHILTWIGFMWGGITKGINGLNRKTHWDVELPEALSHRKSYLIISNHQSWTDILVLFHTLNYKVPAPRFFIKPPKKWNPFFRALCWHLDFPVVQRYSKEFLGQYPELKGKDLETTRHFCEKFKDMPFSIINFAEGTRFTVQKHQARKSPFQHLLIPKAGGMALILSELGQYLEGVLNITIVYPLHKKKFWDFLCGRIPQIVVRGELIPISDEFRGDYLEDLQFREQFQGWLSQIWQQKDHVIHTIIEKS